MDFAPCFIGIRRTQRMEELKARLRKKMFGGQLNCGIDPEILTIGIELTAGHIDRGIKKFADFAKVMIEDLGDAIRPYLKAFYNGARDMPEIMESGLSEEMTPYDEVRTFDVANFDKTSIDAMATAETVARETEVEQEVEVAHKRIKEKRNTRKKSEKKSVTSQQSSELSLFDGIDNNIKEKEDGRPIQELSPSDGTQRKGDIENGVGRADRRSVLPPQSRDTGSTTDVEQGRVDGDIQGRGNDGRRNSGVQGGRSQSEAQRGGSGLSDDAVAEKKNTRNNHSERGEDHAPTSVNARIEANIKAIELAKQLIESGETATPEPFPYPIRLVSTSMKNVPAPYATTFPHHIKTVSTSRPHPLSPPYQLNTTTGQPTMHQPYTPPPHPYKRPQTIPQKLPTRRAPTAQKKDVTFHRAKSNLLGGKKARFALQKYTFRTPQQSTPQL